MVKLQAQSWNQQYFQRIGSQHSYQKQRCHSSYDITKSQLLSPPKHNRSHQVLLFVETPRDAKVEGIWDTEFFPQGAQKRGIH